MRATASKVGLLSNCRWWARPEAEWAHTTSAAAERGTAFHEAAAHYIETGEPLIVREDVAPLLAVAIQWVDSFGREVLAAEVALAWCPKADAAEVIGRNIGRDYSKGAGRLCGSADLVAVQRNLRTGYVGDWSTGDGTGKGPQLRTLAMMLARAEGLDSVTVEALEVDATGVRHVCRETLDSLALDAHAGELAEHIAAIPTSEPQPGPWCGESYCPARATCPAVVERVEQIIPAAELVRHKWGLAIESGPHAVWLYNQAKAVEAAAKLVKDAVKAYVPEGGITLEDGSTFAEGSRSVERFDKAAALGLLRDLGATEEQIAACSRTSVESAGLRITGGAAKPRRSRKVAA